MRRWQRLRRSERGLTIVEVLLAIVILGIIVVPLGNAFIGFYRHSDETTRHLSESHDAQIAAAYFAQDVQSVGVRDWTGPFPYEMQRSIVVPPLGSDNTFQCGPFDAVVRFAWDDPTASTGEPAEIRVTYAMRPIGTTENQLVRYQCRDSANPESEAVLAHDVLAGTPTVTCNPACASTGSGPQTVTLEFTIKNPASQGAGIPMKLVGQRRQL